MEGREPPLGLALIGASGFGAFCLEAYAAVSRVRSVGVWNRTFSRGEALARRLGIRAFRTLEELLACDEIDVVHIATPPFLHASQAIRALEAGKHVLCEKPLALTLDEADAMIDAARRADRRLTVDFLLRYTTIAVLVKGIVDAAPFGAPLFASLENCAGDDKLVPDHWFWDRARSGGIFVEHGVHFFDLYGWWLGEGRVQGAAVARRPGTAMEDQAACLVRHGDAVLASFYHGFHQGSAKDRQRGRIVFEHGEIDLEGWVPMRLEARGTADPQGLARLREIFGVGSRRTRDARPSTVYVGRGRRLARARPFEIAYSIDRDGQAEYRRAAAALMEDFVASIRDPSRMPRVGAEDGRKALALAVEADRLARAGGGAEA